MVRTSTNCQQTKTLELLSVDLSFFWLKLSRLSSPLTGRVEILSTSKKKGLCILSHRNRSSYNHTTYGVEPLAATLLAWQPSGYHSISLFNRSEAKPSGVVYPHPVENYDPPRGESWPGRIDIRLQTFLSFFYGL